MFILYRHDGKEFHEFASGDATIMQLEIMKCKDSADNLVLYVKRYITSYYLTSKSIMMDTLLRYAEVDILEYLAVPADEPRHPITISIPSAEFKVRPDRASKVERTLIGMGVEYKAVYPIVYFDE